MYTINLKPTPQILEFLLIFKMYIIDKIFEKYMK